MWVCLLYLRILVTNGSRAAAPKGMKSCRTLGEFLSFHLSIRSSRISILPSIHLPALLLPKGWLESPHTWIWPLKGWHEPPRPSLSPWCPAWASWALAWASAGLVKAPRRAWPQEACLNALEAWFKPSEAKLEPWRPGLSPSGPGLRLPGDFHIIIVRRFLRGSDYTHVNVPLRPILSLLTWLKPSKAWLQLPKAWFGLPSSLAQASWSLDAASQGIDGGGGWTNQ